VKILFFAPHSAIWVHAFPEALVAEALTQHGNEIVYVGCGGLLRSHCVSMSAFGVSVVADPSEKERICRICKKNESILRSNFSFSGPDLIDKISVADFLYADEVVALTTQENCLDLMIDGVEIGRIALYELLLDAKKSTLDFSDSEWARYQVNLRNAVLTLRGMQQIFLEYMPERVVLYNALYTVNRIAARLAELRETPQYFLHAGANLSIRLQTLLIGRGDSFSFYRHLVKKWKSVREKPCSSEALAAVTDHFLEVTLGRSVWAYSAAPDGNEAELKKYFGIRPGQKVICAAMSSYDERFAGEVVGTVPSNFSLLFPRQVDWINALIEYVEADKDLFLIIRVHPREFPNKREGVLSEHAKMLQHALLDLPINVRVNWPTDNISMYSLAKVTDVFANSWSSVGKEMGLLGLPVVLYSPDLPVYPSDLNYVGTTYTEYFFQLEKALAEGWSAERIRKTYRWCAIEFYYMAFDISESFKRNENEKIRFKTKVKNKLIRSIAPYYQQYSDCKRRAPRLSISEDIDKIFKGALDSVLDLPSNELEITLTDETIFLKREVNRLLRGLYGLGADFPEDSLAKKLQNFV